VVCWVVNRGFWSRHERRLGPVRGKLTASVNLMTHSECLLRSLHGTGGGDAGLSKAECLEQIPSTRAADLRRDGECLGEEVSRAYVADSACRSVNPCEYRGGLRSFRFT